MASWWRHIALLLGDGSGTGSWKKRAARALGITSFSGQSWPEIIYNAEPEFQRQPDASIHTRRLVDPSYANLTTGSWAKRLLLSGELTGDASDWIFADGTWNDSGFWRDNGIWP